MIPTPPDRLAFVDALKAVASQLIVLHHLAFYGPLSDRARTVAPGVIDWFADHARIAVQAFLVIGGFLAARSLAPAGRLAAAYPSSLVAKRYLRLVLPYAVVIGFAMAAAHVARSWMPGDTVPAAPGLAQLAAHLLLLQDVLGHDSLSAGLWYVAIDFQLFVLLLGILWLARYAAAEAGAVAVGALGLASLAYFNRDATWDAWAVYFFGAYALGAIAYWSSTRASSTWLGVVAVAAALAALAADFRVRIAVALAVAVLLFGASRAGALERRPGSRTLAWLGGIAYSVFLAHYPVLLIVNAFWERFLPHHPWTSAAGLGVAWAASVGAGALLHRHVERPAGAWLARRAAGTAPLRRA